MATVKLTAAVRRALDVLAADGLAGMPAKRSNYTDPDRRLIYWQSVDWLYERGYVDGDGLAGGHRGEDVRLTDVGWELVKEVAG